MKFVLTIAYFNPITFTQIRTIKKNELTRFFKIVAGDVYLNISNITYLEEIINTKQATP